MLEDKKSEIAGNITESQKEFDVKVASLQTILNNYQQDMLKQDKLAEDKANEIKWLDVVLDKQTRQISDNQTKLDNQAPLLGELVANELKNGDLKQEILDLEAKKVELSAEIAWIESTKFQIAQDKDVMERREAFIKRKFEKAWIQYE